MRHDISTRDWLAYTGSSMGVEDRRRVRQHLEQCESCRDLASALAAWREVIASEAEALRPALGDPSSAIEPLMEKALERVRAAKPAALLREDGWTADEAVLLLRSLLEPICGLGPARATIQWAIDRANRSGGVVNQQCWPRFISSLCLAVTSVHGAGAGRLVSLVGDHLSITQQP
jgi:anti-sigma factor RsiW